MIHKDLLYKFFRGMATYEEERAVRDWVEEDTGHREAFLAERKLFDMMILLADRNVDRQSARILPFYKKPVIQYCMRFASVIALILSISMFIQVGKERSSLALAEQRISVPAGQQVTLDLADGTKVCLNSNSTLVYPSVFSKKNRKVKLTGEAYFEVTHNNESPFIVETAKAQVQVLGTKFYVESYPDNHLFSTALIEGSVKVKKGSESFLLKPDQKIVFNENRVEISEIDDYNIYRWREGLICLKNQSFAEILTRFERAYGVNLKLQNKELLHYQYTGKFRRSDGILYALRVLQKDLSFEIVRDNENNTIYIK